MTIRLTRKRAAATVAALSLALTSAVVAISPASATSPAARTAAINTDTAYLHDSLGLPNDTVIESVTYDRFQWLLRQSGQFAFIIGSASDTGFGANAVKVDTAAKAAGATKVYWFNPNLTGLTDVRSLDVRNVANISLSTASKTVFGNIWLNALAQGLGNGYKSTPLTTASVTITQDDTVVNDSVDPIWDYRTGQTAAVSSTDDVFFTYDKNRTVASANDKVASWVNLSTNGSVDSALGAAFTGVGGGAVIDQIGQFDWWKDAANTKHEATYSDDTRYGGDILADSDNANGWVIKQITYPELIHLLDVKDTADTNFVLLFGGTWCHNTRAVIKQINQDAIRNGVTTVYNFDLVLDGGTVNGTNGGTNPIHVRSAANSASTFNFRPSWVYGDVVRKYFKNLVTEYDPNSGSHVTYYPGGDVNAFPDVVRRLQVPFLINYQRGTGTNPATASIKRQWIQRNVDSSTGLANFKEYMSEWWFTNPSSQLGLSFAIPSDESTLDDAQKTALAQARAGATFGAEAISALKVFFDGLPGAVVATREVTAETVSYGTASKVSLKLSNLFGRNPVGNATLSVEGVDTSVAVSNGAVEFTTAKLAAGTHPFTISYTTDGQLVGFIESGNLTVSKTDVASVASSNAKAPSKSKAGSLRVTVATASGSAAATGTVQVTLTKGSVNKSATGTLAAGTTVVALPKSAKGTWKIQVAYLGDGNYNAKTVALTGFKVK